MARRNAQVFYPSYQGLACKLLDRPWTSADGMGADELSQQVQASVAADQLQQTGHTPTMRDIAPLALQEFYLALGVSEMMETNHFFFDPDELEIRDDMVMFVEDADETIAWAVPMDQVSLPDPIVYRRTVAADEPDDTGQWEST